ncbi:hypothetical protein PYW07_013242 [Mythimna separata]|uniref:Uncharacterized protein n=1 Tax=Mythimna separata TaxID=271217 RepID=A0AAD7Y644_MYTSE|nr:hypothetical protein PYW07_013242 [Mythimna separata]
MAVTPVTPAVTTPKRAPPSSRVHTREGQHGIKITVPFPTDYRELSKLLKARNISFHSYSIPEETPERVIIKGIPHQIKSEEVLEDLKSQGVPVQAVHRLQRRQGGEYDMVLAVVARTELLSEDGPKSIRDLAREALQIQSGRAVPQLPVVRALSAIVSRHLVGPTALPARPKASPTPAAPTTTPSIPTRSAQANFDIVRVAFDFVSSEDTPKMAAEILACGSDLNRLNAVFQRFPEITNGLNFLRSQRNNPK